MLTLVVLVAVVVVLHLALLPIWVGRLHLQVKEMLAAIQ
jgi:hypothetical protein